MPAPAFAAIDPSAPVACSEEDHAAVKADPVRWEQETRDEGTQAAVAGRALEMRTHLVCGGTLARRYLQQPVNPQDGGDPVAWGEWLDARTEALDERRNQEG